MIWELQERWFWLFNTQLWNSTNCMSCSVVHLQCFLTQGFPPPQVVPFADLYIEAQVTCGLISYQSETCDWRGLWGSFLWRCIYVFLWVSIWGFLIVVSRDWGTRETEAPIPKDPFIWFTIFLAFFFCWIFQKLLDADLIFFTIPMGLTWEMYSSLRVLEGILPSDLCIFPHYLIFLSTWKTP